MVMSRKKQCSVSLACSTLQCTRGTDTNITQTIGIITAYVQSAWQGSNKSCAWVWFCKELPNGFAQKLLNPVLIARYPIPYLCHLFWFRPLYSRTPLDSKVCKFPLDQSNLHGKDQKNAVFCSTLQCTRGTESNRTQYVSRRPILQLCLGANEVGERGANEVPKFIPPTEPPPPHQHQQHQQNHQHQHEDQHHHHQHAPPGPPPAPWPTAAAPPAAQAPTTPVLWPTQHNHQHQHKHQHNQHQRL